MILVFNYHKYKLNIMVSRHAHKMIYINKNIIKELSATFSVMVPLYKIIELNLFLKESTYEVVATNKRCVFELIELAYKRFHKDEVFYSGAKLCIAFETAKFGNVKDGKELTKDVLRKCRKTISEELKFAGNENQEVLDQTQLQLHCSAYNCLVSLFIRTQTEPKLYLACLFKDDSVKSDFIFEPLIDKNKSYKFSMEVDNYQERKTKFISLRNELKNSSGAENDGDYIGSLHSTNTLVNNALATSNSNATSYLNTQHMYESSLSEELSIFDFTGNSAKVFCLS